MSKKPKISIRRFKGKLVVSTTGSNIETVFNNISEIENSLGVIFHATELERHDSFIANGEYRSSCDSDVVFENTNFIDDDLDFIKKLTA